MNFKELHAEAQEKLLGNGDCGAEWHVMQVEACMVEAAWTLRRLPDKERGYLYARAVQWPAMKATDNAVMERRSAFSVRLRTPPSPKAIDRYEGILDWLHSLPDLMDRQIVFWVAWHLNGEQRNSAKDRISWTKVRASVRGCTLSRQHLLRRYKAAMESLALHLTGHGIKYKGLC